MELRGAKQIGKSSRLRKLSPILKEDGTLCVRGRLTQLKYPCIIPPGQVANHIIREYHEHLGVE